MTGFRLAAGGAQERYGVTPDITALGKVLGGGMAVAAFGGSRELMRWEADNRVVHGGTYTGSPLGLAASAAVLRRIAAEPGHLRPSSSGRSAQLADGIEAAFADAGVDGHVRRVGSMLQPFLAARPQEEPRDVNEAAALQPAERYLAFCDGLEARGVVAHRYALGRWFVSLAHGDDEIEATLAAVRGAVEGPGALSAQRLRHIPRVKSPKTTAIARVVTATDHCWVAMPTPAIASSTTV